MPEGGEEAGEGVCPPMVGSVSSRQSTHSVLCNWPGVEPHFLVCADSLICPCLGILLPACDAERDILFVASACFLRWMVGAELDY